VVTTRENLPAGIAIALEVAAERCHREECVACTWLVREVHARAKDLELGRGEYRGRRRRGVLPRDIPEAKKLPRDGCEGGEGVEETVCVLQLAFFVSAAGFERLEELLDDPAPAVAIDYRCNFVRRSDGQAGQEQPLDGRFACGHVKLDDTDDVDHERCGKFARRVARALQGDTLGSDSQLRGTCVARWVHARFNRRHPCFLARRKRNLPREEHRRATQHVAKAIMRVNASFSRELDDSVVLRANDERSFLQIGEKLIPICLAVHDMSYREARQPVLHFESEASPPTALVGSVSDFRRCSPPQPAGFAGERLHPEYSERLAIWRHGKREVAIEPLSVPPQWAQAFAGGSAGKLERGSVVNGKHALELSGAPDGSVHMRLKDSIGQHTAILEESVPTLKRTRRFEGLRKARRWVGDKALRDLSKATRQTRVTKGRTSKLPRKRRSQRFASAHAPFDHTPRAWAKKDVWDPQTGGNARLSNAADGDGSVAESIRISVARY
jgi:hypothetical protein